MDGSMSSWVGGGMHGWVGGGMRCMSLCKEEGGVCERR